MDPENTGRPLEALQEHLRTTPFGRYGRPEDPAELIGWLATDAGAWMVGQALTTDGGFGISYYSLRFHYGVPEWSVRVTN